MDTPERLPRRELAMALLGALAAMLVVRLARGDALFTAGEGNYALTSRLLLDGGDLYGDIATAQPPNMFLSGAALLTIHDSLGALRAGIGALQIAAALLGAMLVWRMTASRVAAVAVAPLMILTPWAVAENSTLIPEVVALPLVLGAAVLATSPRTSGPAGAVAAVAVFVKLPMLLPLAALAWAAGDRRRFLVWATGTLVFQAALFTAIFGSGLWDGVVLAQVETGRRSAAGFFKPLAQGLWNSGAVILFAGVGLLLRERARDVPAVRVAMALALAAVLTIPTISKNGTGLYVFVFVESCCLPLAVAGAVWLGRRAVVLPAAALVLLLAQSTSELASPTHPRLFVRPFAPIGYAANLDDRQVDAAVRAARRCPPGVPYSGESYIAFLARRGMPGGQPDTYIIHAADRFADARARALQDQPRCP